VHWSIPAAFLALVASCLLAGCAEDGEKAKRLEILRRHSELERRLRTEVQELRRANRELRMGSDVPDTTAEAPSARLKALEEEVLALTDRVSILHEELAEARRTAAPPAVGPHDVARRFLGAVIRSDEKEISGLVDWSALAEETFRRESPDRSFSKLSSSRRRALISETRGHFLDTFTAQGAGRQLLLSLVEQSDRQTLPLRILRVDLGAKLSETRSRCSLMLSMAGGQWKIAGVLQESIEAPAEFPDGQDEEEDARD